MTSRVNAKKRTEQLIFRNRTESFIFSDSKEETDSSQLGNILTKKIRSSIEQSGVSISVKQFASLCVISGIACAGLAIKCFSLFLAPALFFGGLFLPYLWLGGKINKRSIEFSSDYPTVLLAMASSIKVGHTAYMALERATRLLPEQSIVRNEVNVMLSALRRGESRDLAVANFGKTIRQPELDLFRKAFLLVTENGGRFAPTLERLALVSKDRATLTSMARVSTTNMRMTANMLLVICPIVLGLVAVRTENYWDLFFNHPVASTLSTIGLMVILGSYTLLQKMSSFKP
jgi:tight adherence protein B